MLLFKLFVLRKIENKIEIVNFSQQIWIDRLRSKL